MIAVDANGADAGPATVLEGARQSGEPTLVFGHGLPPADDVVEAPGVPASDNPVRAVRSSPDASIVQAAASVADGRAEALVSAGSTGPTLAAATLAIKRLKGVHRPALAVLVPIPAKPVLLLDCGANVEVRPEHLVQFAYMGSAFMEVVMGVERPSVGLLSVGEESGKGTPDVLEARERLEGGPLNFAGNLEGFDLPGAGADVVVADGFTGNIALKVLEGTSKVVRDAIRGAVTSNPVSSVGGLLIRGSVNRLRDSLDLLAELGVAPERGRESGGGARSELWLRIIASVLELPLERPEVEEGAAYGAALLAGVAGGTWPDIAAAVQACVRTTGEIEPDPAWVTPYAEGRERFRALYPALRGFA